MPKGYLGIQNDLQIADDLHLAYVSSAFFLIAKHKAPLLYLM